MCPVLEITSWFACDNNRSTLVQVLCCLSTKYLEEDQQTWHLESELQFCGLVEFEVWQNGHSPPIVLGYSYVSYVRQQTRCGWLKSLREIRLVLNGEIRWCFNNKSRQQTLVKQAIHPDLPNSIVNGGTYGDNRDTQKTILDWFYLFECLRGQEFIVFVFNASHDHIYTRYPIINLWD